MAILIEALQVLMLVGGEQIELVACLVQDARFDLLGGRDVMIVDGVVDFLDGFLRVRVARLSELSKLAKEVVHDRYPYRNDRCCRVQRTRRRNRPCARGRACRR